MANYLDPKNDLTFKRVFGEHKHLCISLINNILPLEKPVIDIEYRTGELIPDLDVLRNTIIDVRCIDESGRQFLVEMQLFWYESFKKRVVLNASKAYVMQLDVAEKFSSIQPVYSLNFVNKNFEKSPEMENEYFHHYKTVNIHHTEKRLEGYEFVFIELPKFKPANRAEKKLHELWLRFLTEVDENTEEISPDLLEHKEIREAVSYTKKAAYTKEQLTAYDQWKINLITARSMLDDAEDTGIAKGEVIGLEKGEAIGEHKKACLVALKALEKGMTVEDASELSGLSIQQIEQLIKK